MRSLTYTERKFHIIAPYYGAWTKYGWEKNDWGIGLSKKRIDDLGLRGLTAIVSYRDSIDYEIDAREVQEFPISTIKGKDKVKVYIVKKSALVKEFKESEDEALQELSKLCL